MDIIDGFKTCKKGLHQYRADKKRCPECYKITQKRYYERNTERVRERTQNWYKKNLDKARGNIRRYREQNLQQRREYYRHWREQNLDKHRAAESYRRALKKQATPLWADHTAINAIYAEAARLEKNTKIKYHVDHIYPLTSPYMCGLHVAENLQILTEKENCSKSNRTWPGQLEIQKQPIDQIFTPEQLALAAIKKEELI